MSIIQKSKLNKIDSYDLVVTLECVNVNLERVIVSMTLYYSPNNSVFQPLPRVSF